MFALCEDTWIFVLGSYSLPSWKWSLRICRKVVVFRGLKLHFTVEGKAITDPFENGDSCFSLYIHTTTLIYTQFVKSNQELYAFLWSYLRKLLIHATSISSLFRDQWSFCHMFRCKKSIMTDTGKNIHDLLSKASCQYLHVTC